MPEFHEKMKERLRTVEQGADTIVWLAIAKSAQAQKSGQFYQDRVPVSTHLPLALSRSSETEDKQLMAILEELATKHQK